MIENHEMVMERKQGDVEEWACPTCGRRLAIQWHPVFEKVVLFEGDQSATHSGSKGRLKLTAEVAEAKQTISDELEDLLHAVDFTGLDYD